MADERQLTRLKVFISYSRADEAFVDELKLGLDDKGYTVEIDKQSIRYGEDFKARLTKLIAASDTVICVLSPDSVRSAAVQWEIAETFRLAKRIVPILHRGLNERPKRKQPDGSPWPEALVNAPERLSLLNYPRFDEGRSFMLGLRALVQALEDDLGWIDAHSRLANRARDWDQGGRTTNRLMSGPDVAAAKRLIEERKPTAPPMQDLQLDYIQASEAYETAQNSAREQKLERERRRTLAILFTVTVLAIAAAGFGIWAEFSRRAAIVAQEAALAAQQLAERRTDRLKLAMMEAMTEPTAVKESLGYLVEQEVGSREAYEQRHSRPSALALGVTIGFGYDLGAVSADQFEADWNSVLPEETIARLKPAARVTGADAKKLVETLKDIEVPFAGAQQVFVETAVPKYYQLMTRIFPGASELPFGCQGALLSLVYNVGSNLDRRPPMRAIRDAIAADKLEFVPAQLREMKSLAPQRALPQLAERREGEALMCEKAIRLREKVRHVLPDQN